MGALLPSYKTTVINSLLNGISANTTCLFAFASNPTPFSGNTPAISLTDYSSAFWKDWQLLFGKRLQLADVVPVIRNITWTTNTVYSQYDNTNASLANANFYVLAPPAVVGGAYNVYKVIGNANGAASTSVPSQVQPSSFTTADGYIWRYVTTITASQYDKFSTTAYSPVYTNTTIRASSFTYSGVENCVLTNGGNGYSAYSYSNSNLIVSVLSSTLLQVQNYEAALNNAYVGNAIYLYNGVSPTSQLLRISGYTSNSIGNFVTLASAANTTNIQALITKYYITPAVVFQSDGNTSPSGYTTINTTSNSILGIVITDSGSGITWCNVSIQTNTSAVSTNAVAYAIVPPPGGHGFDPASELYTQGIGISFTFANSEANTIPTNVTYNQIGLLCNPNAVFSNTAPGALYTTNTFSSVLTGNLSPTTSFAVGNVVTGATSNAVGTVAFCNGTHIHLTGDKDFTSGETIVASNGTSAAMTINSIGQVYTKDIKPLYIQNITNVTRSNTAAESYKLIIGL